MSNENLIPNFVYDNCFKDSLLYIIKNGCCKFEHCNCPFTLVCSSLTNYISNLTNSISGDKRVTTIHNSIIYDISIELYCHFYGEDSLLYELL